MALISSILLDIEPKYTTQQQVGILDVERMKVKTHLRTPHKKEVYSLVWQDHFIYFIVNRVLGFFDLRKSKIGEYMFLAVLYLCCRQL